MGKLFWSCPPSRSAGRRKDSREGVDSLALDAVEPESGGMQSVFRLSALALLAAIAAGAFAGEVAIQSADFRLVDLPEGDRSWYEVAIELEVDRSDAEARRTSRFASDVTVRAALAFQVEGQGEDAFVFYASEVEFVALEVGRGMARFYLPAEVVDRDRIRGEPYAFEIVVEQGGERADALVSRSIQAEAALKSFRARLSLAEESASGILRPQHLTPFWLLYPDSSPTARLR